MLDVGKIVNPDDMRQQKVKTIRDARFSRRILVDFVSVRNGGGRDYCAVLRRKALVLTACSKRLGLAVDHLWRCVPDS